MEIVVEALNKPPYNKNFNVITFDSLTPEDLLQILSDVLQSLNEEPTIDTHLEEFEQTINRILNMLHILRYKQFTESTSESFQQNLKQCEKSTIYNILEWLLSNADSLKQRIYLARYLMKIDIPSDILGNSDIATLHHQYLQLLEEFKKTHKECFMTKNSNKMSISELRSDGVTMEKEKEIVSHRIDQIKQKVNNIPNAEQMLQSCHHWRTEQERKKEIDWQLQAEIVNVRQGEQRLFRLSQQLQEIQKRSVGLSSQAFMKKLEEELYVTSYIVEHKLPEELNQQKKKKEILENILYSNNITQASNETLLSKTQNFSQQINKLLESRLTISSNAEDETVLFRQQATIIARKKDELVDKFSQLKAQMQEVYSKLQYKQQKLDEEVQENGNILKDSQMFQEYVTKFKTKSNIYQRYRNDIASFKAENEVLSRTVDILRARGSELGVDLSNLSSQSDVNKLDEGTINKSKDSLVALITQFDANIASQKLKLTPMISQVKPLRENVFQLSVVHKEKKRVYDKVNITLNTSNTKLLNNVNELQEEHSKIILEQGILSANIHISGINFQRANQEFQNMVSRNNATPLFRDRLNHRISESEKVSKLLKEEQKQIRNNEKKDGLQKNLWGNIKVLFEMKVNHLRTEREEMSNLMHSEKGTETLVLR